MVPARQQNRADVSQPSDFSGEQPANGPTSYGDRSDKEARLGVLAAFAAYGSWGTLTLYYAALSHVPSIEVVANRVSWSLLLLGLFFLVRKRWGEVWLALINPKVFWVLLATSVLISINWLTYIWAVSVGHATEASLGYFIVPLLNVAMGYVFLSERLSRLQIAAIILAVAAILLQLVLLGTLPVVSLVVAFTFGTYGYLRKIVPVGPNLGLLIELLFVAPFAISYVIYVQMTGEGHLSIADSATSLLLLFTGVVTYLPLMWFSAAAKRLRLSTLGIMQYMNPTIQFLIAVFVLQEDVSMSKLATFALIWLSVLVYSYDAILSSRQRRNERALQA